MHERPGHQRTGKKSNPWVLAISAHDRLAQAIDVTSLLPPEPCFLAAILDIPPRSLRPALLRLALALQRSGCDGNTHSSLIARIQPTFFGELLLSGDECVFAVRRQATEDW